jgi:hypothetical protein
MSQETFHRLVKRKCRNCGFIFKTMFRRGIGAHLKRYTSVRTMCSRCRHKIISESAADSDNRLWEKLADDTFFTHNKIDL